MNHEEAIFDGIRALRDTDQEGANLIWWLHVIRNDKAAMRIIEHPDLLQTDETVNTMMKELAIEPKVLALREELGKFEKWRPDGIAAAQWMRTQIGYRALMGEPWVKRLDEMWVKQLRDK